MLDDKIKPFLKWAGSKQKIIENIKKNLPPGRRLIEPFVGSGSVFLNTEYSDYFLADINKDLISVLTFLQREGYMFIRYCEKFFEDTTEKTFYERRDLFNETTDLAKKAGLFVYLNRHCFNGLCRYNSKGLFNVPFGKYKKPYFPKEEMAAFYHKAYRAQIVSIDFRETFKCAEKGDIIYCDPPYVPLKQTSNFTSYSADGFGVNDQIDLMSLAEQFSKKGIYIIISNHDTEFTRELYKEARFIDSFEVQRFISANPNNRKKVKELVACYG